MLLCHKVNLVNTEFSVIQRVRKCLVCDETVFDDELACLLQCFDTVGIIWRVQTVHKMTYKVLSGTLSLYSLTHVQPVFAFCDRHIFWNSLPLDVTDCVSLTSF